MLEDFNNYLRDDLTADEDNMHNFALHESLLRSGQYIIVNYEILNYLKSLYDIDIIIPRALDKYAKPSSRVQDRYQCKFEEVHLSILMKNSSLQSYIRQLDKDGKEENKPTAKKTEKGKIGLGASK